MCCIVKCTAGSPAKATQFGIPAEPPTLSLEECRDQVAEKSTSTAIISSNVFQKLELMLRRLERELQLALLHRSTRLCTERSLHEDYLMCGRAPGEICEIFRGIVTCSLIRSFLPLLTASLHDVQCLGYSSADSTRDWTAAGRSSCLTVADG